LSEKAAKVTFTALAGSLDHFQPVLSLKI